MIGIGGLLKGGSHKRCKTKSSPMTKRALGCCHAMESDTTPLRKTAVGIRSPLMSRSSPTSDGKMGNVSSSLSGDILEGSLISSVTPVHTEGIPVDSEGERASPSAPGIGNWSTVASAEVVGPSENPSTSSGRVQPAGFKMDPSSSLPKLLCTVGKVEEEESDFSSSNVGFVAESNGSEGLLSTLVSEVGFPTSQGSLGEGFGSFGGTDSLARGTKDELDGGSVWEGVRGECSPGRRERADGVSSTDGSRWLLVGTVRSGGREAS